MPHYPTARVVIIVLAIVVSTALPGCVAYPRPYDSGGYVYFDYWYYPGIRVYYDIHRHIYFYPDGGNWIQVRVLPPELQAHLGTYVVIKSRYQQPYREFSEHHRRYPEHYYQPPQKPQPDQYRYVPPRGTPGAQPYEYRHEEKIREQNMERDERRERQDYRYQPPQKHPNGQYHYVPPQDTQGPGQHGQRRDEHNNTQRDTGRDDRYQAPSRKAAPAKDNRRSYDKYKSDKDDSYQNQE